MNCATCGSEIQSSFKHAISKNECPFCGGFIMGEEMMALIEDIEKTILSEATVREETAKKLAMTIVARYNIIMKDGIEKNISIPQRQAVQAPKNNTYQESEKIKTAPPSSYQQITKEPDNNSAILEMSKILAESSEMSEAERERLLEEAVREKYNMVDQTTLDSSFIEEEDEEIPIIQGNKAAPSNKLSAIFSETSTNSVLEQERLVRLARQQQALRSGSGAFRRGG